MSYFRQAKTLHDCYFKLYYPLLIGFVRFMAPHLCQWMLLQIYGTQCNALFCRLFNHLCNMCNVIWGMTFIPLYLLVLIETWCLRCLTNAALSCLLNASPICQHCVLPA